MKLGIGYFISEEHINKEYTTEAVKHFISYSCNKWGYDHVVAIVKPENHASCRVLEKSSFQYVSKLDVKTNAGIIPFNYYRHDFVK